MIFHHDVHLMVFKPRGVMTEERVMKDIGFLEEAEDRAKQPFNRFTDVTKADVTNLHFRDVLRISLHRRLKYGSGPPVKSAFYITTEEAARVIKMHALLTEHSPLRVRMFEELSAAAEWLGVSVEDLQIGG
jgi:hypothetical protein